MRASPHENSTEHMSYRCAKQPSATMAGDDEHKDVANQGRCTLATHQPRTLCATHLSHRPQGSRKQITQTQRIVSTIGTIAPVRFRCSTTLTFVSICTFCRKDEKIDGSTIQPHQLDLGKINGAACLHLSW